MWQARISINGKEASAALAYNNTAVIHHGEFANLNIIEE
jgi:hypothetical protein